MFKKALILCLAICMLSVNVFAGTSMLSLASDYSADSTPTTSAEETVTPEVVYVTSVTSGDATTQTINYY